MKNFFKNIWDFLKYLFIILGLVFLVLIGLGLIIFIFNGKIYIEIIIIFILFYMFLFWKIWFSRSKKNLIKNYKPEEEEDLGKLAEEEINKENEIDDGKKNKPRNGGAKETEPTVGISNPSIVGLEQSQGRECLPKTNVDSVRKNSSGIRKILRRGRKRNR